MSERNLLGEVFGALVFAIIIVGPIIWVSVKQKEEFDVTCAMVGGKTKDLGRGGLLCVKDGLIIEIQDLIDANMMESVK